MQLRQLEEQNARLEQLREVTQRAYTSQGAGDGDEDEDEDPEAVEAHLAVLMTQLEVRGPLFLVCKDGCMLLLLLLSRLFLAEGFAISL